MRHNRRPSKWVFLVAALAGLPVIGTGIAFAQSGDADMRAIGNRLDRIENEISDLQRQSYSGASSGSPASLDSGAGAADLHSRVIQLEEQVREINGRVEEANHRAAQAERQLELFKADVELRFQDMQGGGAGGSDGGASASREAGDGGGPAPAPAEGTLGSVPADTAGAAEGTPSVLPNGTPETQYDFAIDLMKRGQYDQARQAFQEFLQIHPKHELAGNAQYWLGETYYAQNNYKQAGDAFLTGYTTYASSSKAPDSLLKLGMSLAALDNKDAACTVWGELGSKFPQASPSVVARARLERQKAGC
ncbi:MAG: tol-pal system protein YbgF [Parvibaculum sp.]|uniref:tol-pal system protein YbgF n=1 Tax=Parvibaculum sp. TaxID=2024848 RepID=UPI003265AA57